MSFGVIILILVVLIFVWVTYTIKSSHQKANDSWKSILTMQEYSMEYADCKTKNGFKCCSCGSNSIKNWGVNGTNDPRRVFICNHCGATLYRSS